MAAISDPAIHDVWLPVDQFREYLHEKYSFGDNIQFNTNRLIRYLNKVFPNQFLEHHLLESSNMGQTQKATGPISTWYCSSKIALMFSKYSTLNSISCFFLITPVGTTVRKRYGFNVEWMTKSYGRCPKRLRNMANTWLPGTSLT